MTQAPLPSTYADFWTMVLEQHVELIVCLLSESQVCLENLFTVFYSLTTQPNNILKNPNGII